METFVPHLNRTLYEWRYNPSPTSTIEGPYRTHNLLSEKPATCTELYANCSKDPSYDDYACRLDELCIVRLKNGEYSIGNKCFFHEEGVEDDDQLPRVDDAVYTSGKSKAERENAREFLLSVGVREVGEAEEIEALLKRRYCSDKLDPRGKDIRRFIKFVEEEPNRSDLFADFLIFEGGDGKWHKPSEVFLDEPYLKTGLRAYYSFLENSADRVPISRTYLESRIKADRLVNFAKSVGAAWQLVVQKVPCQKNPNWRQLCSSSGNRVESTYVNEDWTIPGLEDLLNDKVSLALSQLIWQTMCSLRMQSQYLRAKFRWNRTAGYQFADSQLVYTLREAAWVPQGKNTFVRPCEADRARLLDGFQFDPGWAWIKAVSFGENVAKRSEEQRRKREYAKNSV